MALLSVAAVLSVPAAVSVARTAEAAVASAALAAPPSPPSAGDRRRVDAVLEGDLEQAWTRPDLRCPDPPLVDDLRVFVLEGAAHDRRLVALDARHGRTLWRSGTLPSQTLGPRWFAAYADGRVYVNDQLGDVHAFDARTGVRVWSRWLGYGSNYEESAVLAVDGRVFVSNAFGLTALDGASGQTLWRHAPTLTRPIYADGWLYANDTVDAGVLRALSPVDGTALWATSEGQRDFGFRRTLLAQNGLVHTTKGAFDGASGRLMGPARGYTSLDDDLGVTREPDDFGILVERVADRAPVWAARHDDFSSAVVVAGHTLYGFGNRLTQFDRRTGRPTWQAVLPGDDDECSNDEGFRAAAVGRDFLAVAARGAVTAYREPRVTVRSTAPAHGAASGGQEIRVLGGGLSQARAVRFGTTDVPIERVVSDREVIVRAPALPAGDVAVAVVTAAGAARAQERATYRALGAPRVARAAPTRGPAGGGTLVRLVGQGLNGVAAVRFGDAPATSVSVRSDREVEATAPGLPVGPVTITVSTLDGQTATVPWTVEPGPESRASHPDRVGPGHAGAASGPVGDQLTRLWRAPLPGLERPPLLAAGKLFAAQCATPEECRINAYDRDTGRRLWSTPTLRFVGPGFAYGANAVFYTDSAGGTTALEAATGAVRWTRQSGTFGSFGDDVLADDDLVITRLLDPVGVDPRTGLRRWRLEPRSSNLALGPRGVYSVVGSRGELRKHDRETGTVVWTAAAAAEDGVTAPPMVVDSGVLREAGRAASLAEDATGASRAVAPTQFPVRAVAGDVTYGVVDDPAAAGDNPQLSARRLGGELLWTHPLNALRGAPLVADGRLYVLDTARQVRALDAGTGAQVWSDDAAVADALPFATADDAVTAAERRLLVTTGATATVYAQQGLSVLSVTPATAGPGDTVTLTGSGLSAATDLRVGAVPVESWEAPSDGLLRFTLPADADGGPQQVSVSSDTTASPAGAISTINVDLAPAVTSVAPDSGPLVGGQVVTVRGRGLLGASGVQFGDVLGSELQVVDDTTLRVTTPPRALPETVPVTVIEPVDRRSPPNDAARYRYRLPPLIEELAPATGREGVAATVTLTGAGIDQIQTVLFGDVPATRLDAVDDQTLTVQTPPLAAGSYAVTAQGPGGRSAAARTAYTVAAAPVPGAPRDVTGTSSSSVLRASWLAPESAGTLSGYRIVTDPRGADVTVAAGTLQADLTGLLPGTSYTFAVVPLSDLGSGVVSRSLPVKIVAEAPASPAPSPTAAAAMPSSEPQASSAPSTAAPSSPAASPSSSPTGSTASPSSSPTGSAAPPPSTTSPVEPAVSGRFVPLPPARLFDTRDGTGVRQGRVQSNQPLTVDPGGRLGVPVRDVTAVVLNVTVTGASAAGYVTVFPSGTSIPQASNLNYSLGQTVPNLVTARLGGDGRMTLFANAGAPHLLGDIAGYYTDGPSAPGSLFTALPPARVLDTRDGTGAPAGRPGPAGAVLTVAGRGGVPASGVRAVVLNTTVTVPVASGHLTVYPAGQQQPGVSNLNYVRGQTRANLVVVPVDDQGRVVLVGNAGAPHVIADVVGYFAASGSAFTPLQPDRVLDTRTGNGSAGRLAPRAPRPLQMAGRAGVPTDGATAVLLNVTATGASAAGFVTVYPGGSLPLASNLNYTAGSTVPNLVVVPLDREGNVWFFSNAGSPHAIADVVGYYSAS